MTTDRHNHSKRATGKAWWAVLLALVTSMALAACGSSAASSAGTNKSSAPKGHSGTLQVGLTSAMTSLTPLPYGATDFYLYSLLYDTPVTLSGTKPQPALVQSWSTASDGLSTVLHLRPGVTYSDGTPFNAAALVWNINWEKEPANAAHALALWTEVTATATNATTVTLTYPHALPEIFAMLASAPIVKPNAPNSGIGTGPFVVSKFVPGTSLTVSRNPHYWETGAPHLDSIVFTNYAETATAALALRSGTIGMLLLPPASQIPALKSAGDKLLDGRASNDGYFPALDQEILVNTSTPPLNNVMVRQALSLAFNRSDYVETALDGDGQAMQSVYASSSSAYEPSPSTASFDLAKAKQLLQEAGVSNLTLKIDSVSILPQNTFLPVYEQDLAKIGVKLEINTIDAATWATIVGPGNFPQLITQENGFTDFDPAINFGDRDYAPTVNSEHFTSPQYAAMVVQAAAETNPTKRQADYKAIGAYMQQQMFVIPLAQATSPAAAYSPDVQGVQYGYSSPLYAGISLGG